MWLLAWLADAGAAEFYGTVGIGLPEVVHAEVGGWIGSLTSAEVRYGNVVFNHMVGVGIDQAVLGRPYGDGHNLLVSVHVMANPTLRPLDWHSRGEVLGAYAAPYVGWRYIAPFGLVLRAQAGMLLYEDGGLAVGPNLIVGIGWSI